MVYAPCQFRSMHSTNFDLLLLNDHLRRPALEIPGRAIAINKQVLPCQNSSKNLQKRWPYRWQKLLSYPLPVQYSEIASKTPLSSFLDLFCRTFPFRFPIRARHECMDFSQQNLQTHMVPMYSRQLQLIYAAISSCMTARSWLFDQCLFT